MHRSTDLFTYVKASHHSRTPIRGSGRPWESLLQAIAWHCSQRAQKSQNEHSDPNRSNRPMWPPIAMRELCGSYAGCWGHHLNILSAASKLFAFRSFAGRSLTYLIYNFRTSHPRTGDG